jgi:transposase InsO family protein
LKWIDHYLRRKNVSATCRHFDITRSLFYKWYTRFRQLGIKGLETKSRRPSKVRHRQITIETQNKIAQVRRDNPAWSKYKVAHILKRDHGLMVSSSSVNRVFHDQHLFWPKPISQSQIGAKKGWKIRRIRAPRGLRGAAPGSLIEIDLKVLNTLGRAFYQFTAVDTCTKIKFIKIYTRKTAHCGMKFVEEMITHYPYRIRHINSDNGGEFLAECHSLLESKKITHYFSRARTPKDNPMVENTIKADEYEFWVWGNLSTTVEELNKKALLWMNKFNTYRPHQALNYMTPMEYYENNYQT